MTIEIYFHQSGYHTFKDYYLKYVSVWLKDYFPTLVSYNRFVELKKTILVPLMTYLNGKKGQKDGLYFMDSTSLKVCHNKRINNHKTFKGLAGRKKSSMGWFFGFKLHLIINFQGEIISYGLTCGKVDDRKPVDTLTKGLLGRIYADKGYISEALCKRLLGKGINFITNIKKNMKPKMISFTDKFLLKKRFLIETVNGQLKELHQIEHSRHRSFSNFVVNLLGGLTSYSLKKKKPRIKLSKSELTSI